MKLSHIMPLVIGSAAAGILASIASPAQALTWTANNIRFADGGTLTGSINWNTSLSNYDNINLTLTGPALLGGPGTTTSGLNGTITYNSPSQLVASTANQLILTHNGASTGALSFVRWLSTAGNNWSVAGTTGSGGDYGLFNTNISPQVSGNFTTVPFDIPGGATIPAVGSLLALGAMRKARKTLAANNSFLKVS
jgi:hypothetical protein